MEHLIIGRVIKEWGVNGELKVMPIDIALSDFKEIDTILLQRYVAATKTTETESFEIISKKYLNKTLVIALKGMDSVEKAKLYRHAHIVIETDELPQLEEDEYYQKDLIGLKVMTDSNDKIGQVIEILKTSASDIFVIKDGEKEVLVPVIKQFIDEINIKEGYIKIIPIEGLL
jgi:16S rRNA processing protein RimM